MWQKEKTKKRNKAWREPTQDHWLSIQWRSLQLLEALPVCWQLFETFLNNFSNRQVRKEIPLELVASREVFNQTRSWEDIRICTNNMTMMGIHKNWEVVSITKLAGILRNKKTSRPLYIGRTLDLKFWHTSKQSMRGPKLSNHRKIYG